MQIQLCKLYIHLNQCQLKRNHHRCQHTGKDQLFPGNRSFASAYPAIVGKSRLPITTIAVDANVFQYHFKIGYCINSSLKLSSVQTRSAPTSAHIGMAEVNYKTHIKSAEGISVPVKLIPYILQCKRECLFHLVLPSADQHTYQGQHKNNSKQYHRCRTSVSHVHIAEGLLIQERNYRARRSGR